MELQYPVNLIGIEDDAESGEVLTRYGEYLGTWRFAKDEQEEIGVISFTKNGDAEPIFSEGVPFLDSGMLTGMAMSKLCRAINEWHEAEDGDQS